MHARHSSNWFHPWRKTPITKTKDTRREIRYGANHLDMPSGNTLRYYQDGGSRMFAGSLFGWMIWRMWCGRSFCRFGRGACLRHVIFSPGGQLGKERGACLQIARLFAVIFLIQREAHASDMLVSFLGTPAMHGAGRVPLTRHAVCVALRFSAREFCTSY